jgi:hypothetical protein
MWQAGDGRSIKIWEDRWLYRPTTLSIQTPLNGLDREAKVCELIDEKTRWWNTNLVKEIFDEDEAGKICSMVMYPSPQIDKLVWVGSKNSKYLV